jgi:hypothetical protein
VAERIPVSIWLTSFRIDLEMVVVVRPPAHKDRLARRPGEATKGRCMSLFEAGVLDYGVTVTFT